MIAYLFFHRAAPGTNTAAYEDGLRRFHAAIADAAVDGFSSSKTYRVGDRYCDWYLVQSSAALDTLNEAAVSGARSQLHDAVARSATHGEGKLLKLAAGAYDEGATFEVGFSKPSDMSYRDLYARLEPWTARPGISLWRRMMVLGPPPEFTLLSTDEVDLPPELRPEVFRRTPI